MFSPPSSFFSFAGVKPGPIVLRPFIGLLYPTRDDEDDDCGATGGMNDWQGNGSTGRKPGLVRPCPPQISHDLPWATTAGSQRLTA
jgi:hypothetical protein